MRQLYGVDSYVDVEKHTSGGLSPGRSENLNRSYAFAQMSASGKISNASTAVSSGLVGCRSAESSEFSTAANDASISRSWASRETSIVTPRFCFLEQMRAHKGLRSAHRWKSGAHISCETVCRIDPSRLRYSVFRSHGTCGTDDIGVDVPDADPAPSTGPVAAGSPSRNWSFGSSFGRLLGSGLSSA